jgi:hypothetical protein
MQIFANITESDIVLERGSVELLKDIVHTLIGLAIVKGIVNACGTEEVLGFKTGTPERMPEILGEKILSFGIRSILWHVIEASNPSVSKRVAFTMPTGRREMWGWFTIVEQLHEFNVYGSAHHLIELNPEERLVEQLKSLRIPNPERLVAGAA